MVQYSIPRTLPSDKKTQTVAHSLLNRAVGKGKVVRPKRCSHCGDECKPEAHHWDYTKPYEVAWLCHWCHCNLHRAEEQGRR